MPASPNTSVHWVYKVNDKPSNDVGLPTTVVLKVVTRFRESHVLTEVWAIIGRLVRICGDESGGGIHMVRELSVVEHIRDKGGSEGTGDV